MKKGVMRGAALVLAALMTFETVPMTAKAVEKTDDATYEAQKAAYEAEKLAWQNAAGMKEEVKESITVAQMDVQEAEMSNGDVDAPAIVTASNVTTGTGGDNGGISWSFDSSTMTLTVSGTETDFHGGMDSTISLDAISPFYLIDPDVEKIIMENCTLIGDSSYLFANLQYLTEVEFRNFNTAQVTSMRGMFENCYELTSLDLGGFNTANVTDMSRMFSGAGLTSVNLSSFNTANVTDMSEMFWATDLESVDVRHFNTSKVESMDSMFSLCELTSIDVSNFDTRNVKSLAFMFSHNDSIESLDLSNFKTQNVDDLSFMFSHCENLSNINITSFNTENVVFFMGMFNGCTALKNLDLSHFKTTNAFTLSEMFAECSSLESLIINNFELADMYGDADDALADCDNLYVIYTPKTMSTEFVIELPAEFRTEAGAVTNEITNAYCNTMLIRTATMPEREILIEAPKNVDKITIGNPMQLSLNINGDSVAALRNREFTWTVSDPNVLSVSDKGVVTGMGMGTATVTCTYKYNAAETASYQFTIEMPFTDIKATDWQYPYVLYAYQNNLMGGKSEQQFDMNGNITRSEFVTVLYSNASKPSVTYEACFTDVPEGKWFADAVVWAKQNNVTAGNPDGTFGVYNNITREQLVLMLYQYARSNNVSTDGVTETLSTFADASKVSTWAAEAMKWGVQNSIIGGKNKTDGTYLEPQGKTTRGECATMMMRFVELVNQ